MISLGHHLIGIHGGLRQAMELRLIHQMRKVAREQTVLRNLQGNFHGDFGGSEMTCLA